MSSVVNVVGLAGPDTEDEESLRIDEVILAGERGEEIACVITEAAPANMGIVTPLPGFNEAVRRITSEHGALMILDEVLTGFRVGPGGWLGLEGGYAPDIVTFSPKRGALVVGRKNRKRSPAQR